MKKLVFIFLLLVFVLLLSVCACCWYAGYSGCVMIFINTRAPGADIREFYNFFTPQKFERFRYLLLVYSAIVLFALIAFKRVYDRASVQLGHLSHSLINAFSTALASEFRYLLIIPMLTSFFFAVTMPINFDEALTWMWFTSRGVLSCVGYYPAPNNHILHSVITCITRYIPFLGPVLCLRISSLLASLFTLVLGYSMLQKHFNKNTALLVAGISGMLFMSLYYGYMARGYALAGLFFITAFYATLNIIKGDIDAGNFVGFGLASLLGFYTMPSFLYAFILLNAIILLANPRSGFKLLLTDVITCAAVLLLYMPVIIVNGLDALISNEYVAPLGRNEVLQRLPGFTPYAVHEITGIGAAFFAPLLVVAFILLLRKRSRMYLIIFLVLLAGPFVLVVAHSVIRYSRTFSYYTFVLVFLVVLPWHTRLRNLKLNYFLPVILFLQLVLLTNFCSKIYLYENYGQVANRVIRTIEGDKSYFCDEPMFEIPLQFNLVTGGYNFKFNDTRNVPLSADSLTSYNYVIIRREWDQTQKRIPEIKAEYYNVYELLP